MTLANIIETLKMIALKHPNINSAYEGNIYDILNAKPDNKYASVVITQQSHTTDEIYDHYGFVIFYVDRLVDDMEDNRVQIQSCGKSMLGNIITTFCNEFEAECDNITYQPFTQKFADSTAGVYCTITIDTVKDVYCAERYWDESWSAPVTVIHNQDKRVTFTENGTYTIDYDPTTYTGLGNVEVNVNIDVDSYYNNGYNQGKTDGISEQKSKLEAINITENGTYSKEDGYNLIEVNVPDLNGSYDEGYNQGKTDGVNEQKSKLESISITENGVYSKEDGYNHIEVNVPDLNGSYDEGYNQGYTEGEQEGYNSGYDQGQADIAANARVLEVTENGNYLSKFSDPIIPTTVTGVYANGTDFYSYALISNIIYSTGIIPNQNTRLEFWFKPYGTEYEDWEIIIGSQRGDDTSDTFQVRRYATNKNNFVAEIGTSEVRFTMSESKTEWHHIIMSVADGFVLDGTKIGDFSENMTVSNTPLQIGGSINFNGQRTEEGYYGMIKIDDTIIIPTADGFQNVNTGELLEILKDGSYTYTENVPIYGEGELYKTINVNVIPKINLQKTGFRLGFSTFTEIPEWVDFEGITDMNRMFSDCRNLKTIPLLNTSSVTSMERMFYSCHNLQTIPLLDTSKVSNAAGMFYYCENLKTLPNNLNLGNCTNMTNLFDNASSLTDYSFLETWIINPNADMGAMINNTNTTYVPAIPCVGNTSYYQSAIFWAYGDYSKLTYFGGWIGRKYNVDKDYILKKLTALSYESCISILNNLYDFTGNGETPSSSQGKLKVHQNFLDKVGEQISIATNKGWTITV